MLGTASYQPMLAESTRTIPTGPGWLHERKYDGVRALAHLGASPPALVTRGGHDKARQFPEVAAALGSLHALVGQALVLDGEIVDRDSDDFAGLQRLQRRMGLQKRFLIELRAERRPAAFVAWDVLAVGEHSLVSRPLAERREVLEAILSDPPPGVRLALQSRDGPGLLARAQAELWEGIVSKRADSRYLPGQRSSVWRKLKLMEHQEFVIAGFTHSDAQREFAALVVGYYDSGRLVYAGRVGSGFGAAELAEVARRLRGLQCLHCPFAEAPDLDEPARWVEPRLVAEIRHQGWTDTGRLRSPSFLSIREDKRPEDVRREG